MTKLEELAAVARDAFLDHPKALDCEYEDGWKEVVLAVLDALAEPNDDMVKAAFAMASECTDGWGIAAACIGEHVLEAMIKAVKDEK